MKEVDFCVGCRDNKGGKGPKVFCACVNSTPVQRVVLKIEPGDKNRDRYCPQRKIEVARMKAAR